MYVRIYVSKTYIYTCMLYVHTYIYIYANRSACVRMYEYVSGDVVRVCESLCKRGRRRVRECLQRLGGSFCVCVCPTEQSSMFAYQGRREGMVQDARILRMAQKQQEPQKKLRLSLVAASKDGVSVSMVMKNV